MPKSLSVGIVVPSNVKGGPQKIAAIMASDLARDGHNVTIFAAVLPHYYYFVSLGKRPVHWLKYALRYAKDWASDRKFSFQELLEDPDVSERVRVKFVPRSASKGQLKGMDCLILHSIAQVVEYRDKFPQDRQIYLLWHPEEQNHGNQDTFKAIRNSFNGTIVVTSKFVAREIADHIPDPSLVPAPVATTFWSQRQSFDPSAKRMDILLFWKDYTSGPQGAEIIKKIQKSRPDTSVTIWARGHGYRSMAQTALPNAKIVEDLTESELCQLYLEHSVLLFPSTFEGFGIPPTEALACGCIPILRPEVGAAESYAIDGENSIYLSEDLDNVAGRISSLLDNPQMLKKMREAAPESIPQLNPHGYGLRFLEAGQIVPAAVVTDGASG